ncbi:hypothetical protein BDZ89DRAFT_1018482 [Hymenopellis radicata]|nr:hypothetical protein BDZ89DRAFT_1018482 [Hymenopellis radicata]
MPSRSRSRSLSPVRSSKRKRDRSPSFEDEPLPHNAERISDADYFLKSDEFRIWLKEEKRKYFDELSGEKARSYFHKFVKAWNRGKLSKKLYAGIDNSTIPATSNTSYKWTFASQEKASEADLKAARESVAAATQGSAKGSGRVHGPSLPSAADLQLSREMDAEYRDEERKHKRKRERKEDKERIEDMVGPKEVGREGMLEKKRAKREGDRAFRERGDDGLEADETTLMGGNDNFKAQIARRDAGKQRYNAAQEERAAAIRERAAAHKEKESATMSMFQQLAKQRFG